MRSLRFLMPIRPYLAGRTFAPEMIVAMGLAFEDACGVLGIDANNSSRAMVAQTIIALVEAGHTRADQLAAAAVKEMRGPRSAPT